MENLEIMEQENKLIITFVGSDEERKELNMEGINNSLADLGIARELTQEEFYGLYDHGEVVIELEKSEEQTSFEKQETKVCSSNLNINDDKFALYNKCRGRLVREVFEDYFDDNWWIERAVIRMGAASYSLERFVRNGELWRKYDQLTGPVPINLLDKIVSKDIQLRCTGVDERQCLGYKERKDKNYVYIEVLVDMGSSILKGKYQLIRKEDFLKKYNC